MITARVSYRSVRKQIDAATTDVDRVTDERALLSIASDAGKEDRDAEQIAILASIPPVVLGRTAYRIASGAGCFLDLIGPRGGHSSLVQNQRNPQAWAHLTMTGFHSRTVWYRREPDGTFTRTS